MRLNALLVQHEYRTAQGLKSWSYWNNVGLADALEDNNIKVTIIYTQHIHNFIDDLPKFDVCIINDLLHSFTKSQDNLTPLTKNDLDKLVKQSTVVIGTTAESIYSYKDQSGHLLEFAKERKEVFEELLPYLDGVLLADASDLKEIRDSKIPALWLEPWVHSRLFIKPICYEKKPSEFRDCIAFIGSLTDTRKRFIQKVECNSLRLISLKDEEDRYWNPIIKMNNQIRAEESISLREYQIDHVQTIRRLRFQAELHFVNALSLFGAVAHLPTYFQGPHPRVLLALAAGVPCLSPSLPPPTDQYFEDGRDFFVYDPLYPKFFKELCCYTLKERVECEYVVNEGRRRSLTFRTQNGAGSKYRRMIEYLLGEYPIPEDQFRIPDQVDLKTHNYFLPKNYTSRNEPFYFDDPGSQSAIIWQPDVYKIAAILAKEAGTEAIIDIGCGQAKKLYEISKGMNLITIGIDFGKNIQKCIQNYPGRTWLGIDLDSKFDFSNVLARVPKGVTSGVICSDVIEHLRDPSNLIQELRKHSDKYKFAIITTPEREREHGTLHNGPPINPSHTREWSLIEIRKLFTKSSLNILFHGLTRSDDASNSPRTILTVIGDQNFVSLFPDTQFQYIISTMNDKLTFTRFST